MKNYERNRKAFPVVVICAVSGFTLLMGFFIGRFTVVEGPQEIRPKDRVKKIFDPDGDELPKEAEMSHHSENSKTGNTFSEHKFRQMSYLSNPRLREQGMEEVLSHANLEELRGALKWAESLPDGPSKKKAIADILERWAQINGPDATNYASQIYEATGDAGPLREALQGWAQIEPNAALQKLQSLGLSDGLKTDIRSDLLAQWTEQNPQAAAAYASGNREPKSWQGLVATVANEWSKEDPKSAVDWAKSLPSGLDQMHAINTSISNWYQSSPNDAATYVSSQPSSESRDTMALTLARQVGQEDPSAGLKWAVTVGDTKTQEKAATGALYDTYQKDPQQASQILQSSPLSKAMQDSVMARLQSPGPWWK